MLSVIWPTNVLKTFIESVNAVQEDVKIVFKQDGLFANVIDASHVCFVGIEIPSEKFDSYEVDENVVIPIEVAQLTSIYKISQKKPVKMSWSEEDNGGMVRFEVGGIIKNARLLNADIVADVREMPNISPPIKMRVKTEEYNLGVSAVADVSGLLQMCFEGGKPIMRSDSQGNSVQMTFENDVEIIEGSSDDVMTRLSVEYLKRVSKGLGDSMMVHMGNHQPIKIESKNEGCSFTWLVAPRIDN